MESSKRLKTLHLDNPAIGILDNFVELLDATKDPEALPDSRRGCPSLFTMCLRAVPIYIETESRIRKEIDADDRSNVLIETYDDLEELELCAGSYGWSYLRIVLRAHVLHRLTDAIRNSSFGAVVLQKIMRFYPPILAAHHSDARQRLILAFADYSLKQEVSESIVNVLTRRLLENDTLWKAGMCDSTRVWRDLHVIDHILKAQYTPGQLTQYWVECHFAERLCIWLLAGIGLFRKWSHYAMVVVETLLIDICGVKPSFSPRTEQVLQSGEASDNGLVLVNAHHHSPNSASAKLQKIVICLCASLCTMSIASESEKTGFSSPDSGWPIHSAAIKLLGEFMRRPPSVMTEPVHKTSSISTVLTADLMLVSAGGRPHAHSSKRMHVKQCLDALNSVLVLRTHGKQIQEPKITRFDTQAISKFLRGVAENSQKAYGADGFSLIHDFIKDLNSYRTDYPKHEPMLRSIISECAMASSHVFTLSQHLKSIHAVEMEMSKPLACTPSRIEQKKAFRWEDGLCEWIAATPANPIKASFVDNLPKVITFEDHNTLSNSAHRHHEAVDLDTKYNDDDYDSDDVDELCMSAPRKRPRLGKK